MMKKKKRFNLLEEYKKSFFYIKESRVPVYWIIGIFFVFAIIGFFVPSPELISNVIIDYIRWLLEKTENFGFQQMFGFIFLNNLKSSILSLILGIFFGIFPVYSSLSNGYVLGFVGAKAVLENGASVLWRLIPHGVFELMAVFLALGMGMKLGLCLFERKNKMELLKENFEKSVRVFLLVVLPLLLIAAIIETVFMFFV